LVQVYSVPPRGGTVPEEATEPYYTYRVPEVPTTEPEKVQLNYRRTAGIGPDRLSLTVDRSEADELKKWSISGAELMRRGAIATDPS